MTAAISPGSSGGPVFDASGRVFAIAAATIEGAQQLNFSVPVRYAMGLIDSAKSEQDVADVFLSSRSRNALRSEGSAVPSRKTSPDSSVLGIYQISHPGEKELVIGGRALGASSGLLLAGDGVGLFGFTLSARAPDGSPSPWVVFKIDTLRTNSEGDVALSYAGITRGGYQTRDGFYLSSGSRPDGSDFTTPVLATRTRTPISENTGVYAVDCRTQFSPPPGDSVDWHGEATIMVVDNKIYVDLQLKNDRGGSSRLDAEGDITTDGRFSSLVSKNSGGFTQLTGRLRAGALQAQWLDNRGTFSLVGPMTGERK